MKIKVLITAILLLTGFATMHSQNNMFDRLSDNKDISTVYISKALLNMMPKMDVGAGGADIKSLAGKLEQLEIYSSQSKEAAKLIRMEFEGLTKSKTYETLMAIKDKGDNITFYARKEKDNFKDLIMFVNEPEECTVIRIMGTFTAEDVQKVMNSSNKK
ncbi:MAG: DUF4252 domain-containing protein [Prevotella sp.]|jgi:hypothetical protein|uniref:DUF4252 domain-containing protein n=1 Tax=Dysgonomonas gadei ATCC BAA-286 TaxID=742766 RepID=F5J0W5_9BACT|nr:MULTISPECIES: DUF4252 domain-containing protein [Dysgonomonas]EGK00708.1 hypothetical protein HMPREF9455_02982 [Dysgonomonas gadei ATCC BAA-286]MBF0647281.1 DUF4252 domain-containing protein [Dysgonomonas sp. GY75]MDR1504159.1 DUF4252 domain-containing protein [Prevotella sp.]